ncbi:chorion peroxidase [Anabrus simplex]|uniref:chorion peroxidase n=1 Tax=Anabrus simplex TaxID=316456 RepID=UPI0035A2CDFC
MQSFSGEGRNMFTQKNWTRLVFVLLLVEQVYSHVLYRRSHFTHGDHEKSDGKLKCTLYEGVVGRCVPHMQCPAHVQTHSDKHCPLRSGNTGICCNTGQNHTDRSPSIPRSALKPSISTLKHLLHESEHKVHKMVSDAQDLVNKGRVPVIKQHTPTFRHFQNLQLPVKDMKLVQDQGTMALNAIFATHALKEANGISNKEVLLNQLEADVLGTGLEKCPPPPICTQSMYRTHDGSCNNLQHPKWGAARSPAQKILPPRYSDGVWAPRISVSNQPLPSPRLLSTTFFPDIDNPHPYTTLMVMQFGQFIAHDISLSPSMRHENGSGISCCESDGRGPLPNELKHFACFPIEIPENDPFYSRFEQRCISLVRSMLAPRYDCSLGYAQQMNLVSHFVDGSQLYGTNPKMAAELRTFKNGQLLVANDFGRELPPFSRDPDHCGAVEEGNVCFHSGDTRTNQMIGLVVLDLLFLREHNRLAAGLSTLNPHWSDEVLYQEARRIVIAEIQHILYSEWLPIVVGLPAMEDYRLVVTSGDHSFDYDPDVNPSTTSEFSVAAFRFGHSTADGLLKITNRRRMEEQIFLPDVLFNPSRMRRREFYDRYLDMLSSQPMQQVDTAFTQALTNYMFHGNNPFGVDLVSINIQRGRDHGIATYNDFRELSGLPRAVSFEDFQDRFSPQAIETLQQVYHSPEDVDLFVGGLLEEPVPGALVGPTFLGIIADQFSRYKIGDRFFYENGGQPHSFSKSQLREIKKTTLARLVCDNSDELELLSVSMNPFLRKDNPGNAPLDCSFSGILRMDLRFWKENLF